MRSDRCRRDPVRALLIGTDEGRPAGTSTPEPAPRTIEESEADAPAHDVPPRSSSSSAWDSGPSRSDRVLAILRLSSGPRERGEVLVAEGQALRRGAAGRRPRSLAGRLPGRPARIRRRGGGSGRGLLLGEARGPCDWASQKKARRRAGASASRLRRRHRSRESHRDRRCRWRCTPGRWETGTAAAPAPHRFPLGSTPCRARRESADPGTDGVRITALPSRLEPPGRCSGWTATRCRGRRPP